jgi:hypothetical protein
MSFHRRNHSELPIVFPIHPGRDEDRMDELESELENIQDIDGRK